MLSSGEDKPGSEALMSELRLGCIVLAWLPLQSHVGTRLGPKPESNPVQSDLEKHLHPNRFRVRLFKKKE